MNFTSVMTSIIYFTVEHHGILTAWRTSWVHDIGTQSKTVAVSVKASTNMMENFC